jgi:hypothetical protein
MTAVRATLSVAAALFALLLLYSALTVPAFAATGPAVLAIAFGAVAFFLWPRHRKTAP